MFTPKHLLVNCATLLCLENRDGINTSSSNDIVGEVLEMLPIPETTVDHDHGRQTFLELRQIVIWLKGKSKEEFPTDQEVLQSVQVACKEQTYLFEAIMTPLMDSYESEEDVIKLIRNLRSSLFKYLNNEKIRQLVKDVSHKLIFKKESYDPLDEIRSLVEQLEPYMEGGGQMSHTSMMGEMDFAKKESISHFFDIAKEAMSTEGALRLGWKGLNRMLGKIGALKRGEFVTVGGLQHNFKSGFMLSLFVQMVLFNKPFLRDRTKKPLIVFFTFENEIQDNLLWIYKYIYENETGQAVIDSEINTEEATQFVIDRLRSTGFEVKMYRFDPTNVTGSEFVSILDGLIADGYEIVSLFIDYLNMLSKQGIEAKVAGDDIRLLFRRLRNYTAPRFITTITPHQLSSDALQLTRDNVDDFVKVIANKGYYDGCRRLGQEPDLELMIHIVQVNGESFLTIGRGKHRNTVTPKEDQYCVLPFMPIGTIPWDVDKDYEITRKMPGGGEIGSENETAWWAEAA